jgi:REP element-mobilizing transposase RayT
MARKPRIHLPGGFYHVIFRGNGGQDIFLSDDDRYRLYLLLQEGTWRFGYRVHAFCFMSNHLHLVLQAGDQSLSRGMQNLSFRYTRWINWRARRTGHLFQGRYKALLVESDSHLLELVRYVHLNPLRAGIAQSPDAYPWTSHHAYLGQYHLPWLTTEAVLGQFGKQAGRARQGYARFIDDGVGEGHRSDFHRGGDDPRIIGHDNFVERVLVATGGPLRRVTLEQVAAQVVDAYGFDPATMRQPSQARRLAEARAALAWLARETGAGTMVQVGRLVHRDAGSLSSAVRRLSERAKDDAALAEKLAVAKSTLCQLANLEA